MVLKWQFCLVRNRLSLRNSRESAKNIQRLWVLFIDRVQTIFLYSEWVGWGSAQINSTLMGEREGAILSQQTLEFLHSSICLKPYQICGGWMVVVGGWCLFPILVFSFSKSWSIEDIILQATFVVFCFIWNNFARPNPPLSLPLKLQFGPRIHFNFFSFQIIQCLPVMFWSFSWDFQV